MLLAHKIRIYPTEEQADYLDRACGSRRHCFNQLLAHFKQDGVNWSKNAAVDVYKALREEFDWYSEVSQRVTRNAIDDLDSAFKHFFRRVKAGQTPGFPRFKKRGTNDSFALREAIKFDVDGHWLRIEKLKTWIKLSQKVRFNGEHRQVTISRTADGKYFASVLVETDDYQKTAGGGLVGVDLGIKELAVLSDGTKIPANQKLRKGLRKLNKHQRRLSRKTKGSNRRARAKLKVARIHRRIANQRKAVLHELTDYLTKTYHTICIEDLNVKGMVKNHSLARAVSDAGFGMFRQFLGYKAKLRGNIVVVIDRWFPSSKTCSGCGTVKNELSLSDREFICEHCGLVMDRDHNAAVNILNHGEDTLKPTAKRTSESSKTACGVDVDGVNEVLTDFTDYVRL
jgi:putative transposase